MAAPSNSAFSRPAPPVASRAPAPAAGVPHQSAATETKQPGMLAQMAATAGSVAVGSTIGHGISHMLFGGSSSTPAADAAAPAVPQGVAPATQQSSGISCDVQAKDFTLCLEKADMPSCTWYLEQLKA
ncbi:hypothetical protein CYLTODRAFT_370608, partial [Cylindrobasidium torrendii FP15055 ss-10]